MTTQVGYEPSDSVSPPDSGLGSPVTLHLCKIAFSYALRTALRTLGFLFSSSLALSRPESTPSGSSFALGSHCLEAREYNQSSSS